MSINVGQMAPDFKLPNTEKEFFTLSQFNGKNNVLLLFIPFAFTGVCTTELCSVRDDIARYTSAGAEVLAISIDSPFALKRVKEDQNLPFQLISDFKEDKNAIIIDINPNIIFDMYEIDDKIELLDKNNKDKIIYGDFFVDQKACCN